MSLFRLVAKEICHRKLSFALAVLSVVIAVGVLVGELTLFAAHDAQTRRILTEKEAETRVRMASLEDDYRKIMKKPGFNVLILPADQDLLELYVDGQPTLTMPESYVETLANSKIMLIRHLLPILEQKVLWPERKRRIILAGVRGEVPLAHRTPKRPILQPVDPGRIVLGHELWNSFGLSVGDKVTLMGQDFTVSKCYPARGEKADATAWINLAQAQEMLGMTGRINAIRALECYCATSSLPQIRKEIARILPDTQVHEETTKVLVRAEARTRAAKEATAAIAAEKASRDQLRAQREAVAAWLLPLVIIGCTAWIALLSLTNVRARSAEIGILRAIGLGSRQILTVFLSRALVVGLVGAAIGYVGGFVIGAAAGETGIGMESAAAMFAPDVLIIVMLAAPLLAMLAGWAPAILAARQDPALILREG